MTTKTECGAEGSVYTTQRFPDLDPAFQPLEAHEERRGNGIGVAVSLSVHFLLLWLAWVKYTEPVVPPQPPLRFVQLMRPNREFVEAPGPRTETASQNALFSDANRRASTPNPTGQQPTQRPGQTDALYVPGGPGAPASQASPAPPPSAAGEAASASSGDSSFQYRVGEESELPPAAGSSVDWRNVIRDVGKVASLGGDFGIAGGEEGFAESGPVSFETQWYPWGEYAAGMVARIRRHWYDNMPPIVRMGLRGAVTIRFTIQRSGAITDVEMISSSEVPPYDFAARKAIELASPLSPLPADFPNASERVTCTFLYNQRAPR